MTIPKHEPREIFDRAIEHTRTLSPATFDQWFGGVQFDDLTDGVWMSWWVDSPAEVDALHASAVAQGLIVTYPPTDEPWGVREFHLRHPDGHMFRISAGLNAE